MKLNEVAIVMHGALYTFVNNPTYSLESYSKTHLKRYIMGIRDFRNALRESAIPTKPLLQTTFLKHAQEKDTSDLLEFKNTSYLQLGDYYS